MPANLPPQYYDLEREFKKESDPHEKLRLAKELLAMMPKHKGTDKLQAELKAKISKLNKQVQGGGDKKQGGDQAARWSGSGSRISHGGGKGACRIYGFRFRRPSLAPGTRCPSSGLRVGAPPARDRKA